jgi:hypothetical protein
MSEQTSEKVLSGIDIPKVIAGTLAAVSAAVVGSFLGVAGTLAGAAVASIVGSVGTEIYARSLNKGVKRLQTIAPAFVKAPAAVGTPEVAAAAEENSPSHLVPEVTRGRQIRWSRVAMIAGALFVLAMGALTVAEFVIGEPIASAVGNKSGGGTTISHVLTGNESTARPTPTTSSTPTDHATTSDTPTQTSPTTEPTTAAPTTEPTTVAPTTEPTTTVAPTTGAPQQTGGPGDGGNNVDLNKQQQDNGQGGGQPGE